MFPSLVSLRIRRAALRFAGLLIAVCLTTACLGAIFAPEAGAAAKHPAAEDSAPGQVPKINFISGAYCPKNITPETWTQSSTLWRWIYQRCKPEGAPEQYAYTQEDLELFLIRDREDSTDGFKDCELLFDEWAPNICRISLIARKGTIPDYVAHFLAMRVMLDTLMFLRFNGRSPGAESMLITVRAFDRRGGKTKNLYAIYDIETGQILFRRTDKWK